MNDWQISKEEEHLIETLLREKFETARLSHAKKMAIFERLTGKQPWYKAVFDKFDVSVFTGGKKFFMPVMAFTIFFVVLSSSYVYFAPFKNLNFESSLVGEDKPAKEQTVQEDLEEEVNSSSSVNKRLQNSDQLNLPSGSTNSSAESSQTENSSVPVNKSTTTKSTNKESSSAPASSTKTQTQSQTQMKQPQTQLEAPSQPENAPKNDQLYFKPTTIESEETDVGDDDSEATIDQTDLEPREDFYSPYYFYQFDPKVFPTAQPVCENQCEKDAYRCMPDSPGQIEYCMDGNKDGCTEWTKSEICKEGYSCVTGKCVQNSTSKSAPKAY